MIIEILSFLRVVFGLIFLFLVPGFAFSLVLFPKKDELSFIKRLSLSGAFSVMLDVIITLFIDIVLQVPTTAQNIFLSLIAFTLLCVLIWRIEVYWTERRAAGAN